MRLSDKHKRFVAEYLKDLDMGEAAIRAGYSPKTARTQASRLLTNVEIRRAVDEGQAKRLEKAELSAVRILEELRRLALSDVGACFDESGNLKRITDLTPEQRASISSVEVIIKNAQAGDGIMDTIHKLRFWDKPKALDILAKHFGLLIEKVEHSGTLKVQWQQTEE
jgi:phage terminase small subunit